MFGPIAVVRPAGLASCDLACYNVNEIHQETHQPAPAQAQISTFGHASLEL